MGRFITGFETATDAMALTTGSASYNGQVAGATGFGDDFSGLFTLNADFGNSMVDGDMTVTGFETAVGEAAINFDIDPAAITGKGFAGD